MLRRLGVLGGVVAVSALAVGSVGPATGHGGSDGYGDRDQTVRVLSINTEEAFVDVGDPDFSLGDSFVFSSDLTRHGTQVGHTGVVCTITSTAREESQCVGTVSLHHGQITIQGLVAGEPEVFTLPITGGTGAYEGAGGTLVVQELADGKEILTFRLTR